MFLEAVSWWDRNLLRLGRLLKILSSGEVHIRVDGNSLLHLAVQGDGVVHLNLLDDQVIRFGREQLRGKPFTEQLKMLREIAEDLKREGVTVVLSYRGHELLTLGSKARGLLSQMFTRTDAVEIHNIGLLVRLFL